MAYPPKWTPEMDDVVRAAYATRTRLALVAEELGVTRKAVIGRARRLGLCQPVEKVMLELAQLPWRKAQFAHYGWRQSYHRKRAKANA